MVAHILEIIKKQQLQIYCSKQFLDSLLLILEEDITEQNIKLDKAAEYVVTAKQNHFCDKCLEEARKTRTTILHQVSQIKETVGEINDQLTLEDFPKVMNEMSDLCYDYHQFMEKRAIFKTKQQWEEKIKQQKSCIFIVQETLRSIWNDLHRHGHSQVNGADATGTRPTDILHHKAKTEWQTLSEQVASLISSTVHLPLGKTPFEAFCLETIEICCKELKFLKSSKKKTKRPHFSFKRKRRPKSQSSCGKSELSVNNLTTFNTYSESSAYLKKAIMQHFEEATKALSNYFNKDRDSHLDYKLRIAYENCFYQRIESNLRASIGCLYQRVHHEKMAQLQTKCTEKKMKMDLIKLSLLSASDLWWHKVFENRSTSNEPAGSEDNGFAVIENPVDPTEIQHPTTDIMMEQSRSEFITTVKDQCQTVVSNAQVDTDLLDDLLREWDSRMRPIQESIRTPVKEHSTTCQIYTNHRTQSTRQSTCTYSQNCGELSDTTANNFKKMDSSQKGKEEDKVETNLSQSFNDEWNEIGLLMPSTISRSYEDEKQGDKTENTKSFKTDVTGTVAQEEEYAEDKLKFANHFGVVIQHIKDILNALSPFNKLQKMAMALKELATRIEGLRMQDGRNTSTAAASADDMLTFLVLVLLQIEPSEVALMAAQTAMVEDFMPPFLTNGCYAYALLQFQLAVMVLTDS